MCGAGRGHRTRLWEQEIRKSDAAPCRRIGAEMAERYYITDIFTSDGSRLYHREEMEPEMQAFGDAAREGASALTYVNGVVPQGIIIKYVEEEVTYIADYETNEAEEIKGVHYDPVPVARREKVLILQKRKEDPDTP